MSENENIATVQDAARIAEREKNRLPVVEVHVIRATGGECFNRGFDGRHKSREMNGTTRSTYSTNSKNAAIRRRDMQDGNVHTRMLSMMVRDTLSKKVGVDEAYLDLVQPIADKIVEKTDSSSGKVITSQTLALCDEDLNAAANAILKTIPVNEADKILPKGDQDAQTKAINAVRKQLRDSSETRPVSMNLALLGRMCTDKSFRTVHTAVSMSSAYSLNEISGDVDDFVAQDDYLRMIEGAKQHGAAFKDSRDIWSNVYYEAMELRTKRMLENYLIGRAQDEQSVETAIRGVKEKAAQYIRDFFDVTPSGGRHYAFSNADPSVVYLCVGPDIEAHTMDDIFADGTIVGTREHSVGELADKQMRDKIWMRHHGPFSYRKRGTEYWYSAFDNELPDGTIPFDGDLSKILGD